MHGEPNMSRSKAATASEKILSTRVLVLIDRELTDKVSKVVWAHEIPLLEVVHGEGKVTTIDPSTLDEGYSNKPTRDMLIHQPQGGKQDAIPRPSECSGLGFVFFGDPRAEYERLSSVYGIIKDEEEDRNVSVVLKAYGRFNEGRFERVLGNPELSDLPSAQLKEVVHSYGVAIPDGATDAELLAMAEEAGAELA